MLPVLRAALPALLLCLTTLAPIAAQVTPLTVPKGVLRLDFGGEFRSWDWRWLDGQRQEAAADLGRSSLDRSFIPGLAASEDLVKPILGVQTVDLSLGRSTASTITNLGTIALGGGYGLTRRLTVFGRVPIVSVKVEPRFLIDSTGATAAFNPALGNPVAHSVFRSELAVAIADLTARIAAGDYDADPARKALAQATVTQARTLQTQFDALLAASNTFLPHTASPAAAALVQVVRQLQATMTLLNVTSFGSTPAFPSAYTNATDFNAFVADPTGPIAARPIDEIPVFSYLGDVEIGAVYSLLDRFPTSGLGSGIRAYAQATVRLRTAKLDSPDRFLDVGSGDRQPDVELTLTTDLARGRLGARLSGSYNVQLAGNQTRRVARFDQPIAPATSLAGVRRDPGDVLTLSARPFLRLATYLSLYGGVDYWSKGRDVFTYASGQPPIEGVSIDVLGDGTRADAVLLSGGVSYSHSGLDKRGLLSLPMDASFRYQRIIRSGMGIVPDASTLTIDLRFYTRLFGRR